MKEDYDAKFLEKIDFAFKECFFNFVPKAEELQAINAHQNSFPNISTRGSDTKSLVYGQYGGRENKVH